MAAPPADRAEWTRTCSGLGILTATFHEHRFPPHAHEEYALGVTLGGLERIDYRGGAVQSGTGGIIVLEPGEAHTGYPIHPEGCRYRALYPSAALLGEGTARPGSPVRFRDAVIDDPPLHRALREAFAELVDGTDPLRGEGLLTEALRALVLRHGARPAGAPQPPPPRRADVVARRVRERLGDDPADPPTLEQLAAELGLSRYQLLRAFRESAGMPPYAWLAQHRVSRAKALLDAGLRPAETAAAVGFADQAHLTRWFRRVVGVTPGRYAAR